MTSKIISVFFAVLVAALSGLSTKLHAGPIEVSDDGQIAMLTGEISSKTLNDFQTVISEKQQLKVLMLHSPGGSVSSALSISAAVHALGLATFVPKGGSCASACSMVFFAGGERLAQGKLGVHQMSDGGRGDIAGVQFALAEILDAFEKYGVDRRVSRHMLTTLPAEMYYFNEQEKVKYGINRTRQQQTIAEPEIAKKRSISFAEYPAISYMPDPSAVRMPDFSGRDAWARNYRTRIRNGVKAGPNFAGHYRLVEIGCGTSCRFAYVADVRSGEVIDFPYGGEEHYEMNLLYNMDSRLVKVTWKKDWDTCVQQNLEFKGRDFRVIEEVSFPRRDFCN